MVRKTIKSKSRTLKKAVSSKKSATIKRGLSSLQKKSKAVSRNIEDLASQNFSSEKFAAKNPRIIEDSVKRVKYDVADAAKEMKDFINKQLAALMDHSEYYEMAKKLANNGIDMLVKLGREITIAKREYILIAKDYVRRIMES